MEITNLSHFGDPQNFIASKIPCLTVYMHEHTLQHSGAVSPNLFQLACNQQTTRTLYIT